MTFVDIIDYIGTFAFAISGVRLAAAKKFDWFGAYVVGLVTAVGGGTLRDLLLDITPFWMTQPSYLLVTAFALLCVILFSKQIVRFNTTFFIFDAIGLGLFAVVGITKALDAGYAFWVAIIMGVMTGVAGGIGRDILINEVPLIFRKEFYAMAAVVGGIVFYLCTLLSFPETLVQLISATAVVLARVLAMRCQINLPHLKDANEQD